MIVTVTVTPRGSRCEEACPDRVLNGYAARPRERATRRDRVEQTRPRRPPITNHSNTGWRPASGFDACLGYIDFGEAVARNNADVVRKVHAFAIDDLIDGCTSFVCHSYVPSFSTSVLYIFEYMNGCSARWIWFTW